MEEKHNKKLNQHINDNQNIDNTINSKNNIKNDINNINVSNQANITAIFNNISKKMVGSDRVTKLLLISLLANGHVLLEDVPGTGKTVLAKSLAESIDLQFNRIQFTPDLLPSDITGLSIFNQKSAEFTFHQGPVFCNILLADEINRATPRTQAGLLECMEEHQITTDGKTRPLENPFFVIATQNPLETAGTFALPEAQMDRFLMQISMDLVSPKLKLTILERALDMVLSPPLSSVCTKSSLLTMQDEVKKVYVHKLILDYIIKIIEATKEYSINSMGISNRGMIALLRAAQAAAYINQRNFVVPDDIKLVAVPVLAHRLILDYGSDITKTKENKIITLLEKIDVPTERWERQ